MPPVITLFTVPERVLGIPLIVVYLFGVWLALIGCALWISRHLRSTGRNEPDSTAGAEERSS